MSDVELETTTSDGVPVILRPLGPDDRDGLAEGYRRLSPDARYQRFWVRSGEVIGDQMLDRLLKVDPSEHALWAVIDPSRDFKGVGAGSYWRSKANPEEAEVSFTVLDGDHRRGIGTMLLAVLWLAASREGIREFRGYTMPENSAAVRWMRDTGASAEWDGYQVVFKWQLADLDGLPPTHSGIELAERLAEFAEVLL